MRRRARWLLALALLAVGTTGGALLVATSGLVPVAASEDHWPITGWFLHYTLRRAVRTQSLGVSPPPLDDEAAARRGGGHFADGCAPCHGAPGVPRLPIARGMTPEAPYLPEKIPRWDTAELFWLVKHGVKFTGMPAWPALSREDEVWDVVAFLRRLPTMTPAQYAALADGDAPPATAAGVFEQTLAQCADCHGRDGNGGPAFPRLAGQSAVYLDAALDAYAEGRRHSGFMQFQARGLSPDTRRALARHYADSVADPDPAPVDPAAAARGKRIAEKGLPRQGVPSCADCHGPGPEPRNPAYPRLAGQPRWYLERQLALFRQGTRGGSAYAHLMTAVGGRLSADEARDVAAYYASLPASAGERRITPDG